MSVDWFRSWHGAPSDPKWRTVAKRAHCTPALVVAVAWELMDRASQADERGSIAGYDAETIADFMGCEPEEINAIVDAMREKGVLDENCFSSWQKRQPKREREEQTTSTSRVQAHRERRKNNELEHAENGVSSDETPRNTTKHHETPREDKSREDISSHPSDVRIEAKPPKNPRRSPKTLMAEDQQPTDKDRNAALTKGMDATAFRSEWVKFRCYHIEKATLSANWHISWVKWLEIWASGAYARAGPSRPRTQANNALELMREEVEKRAGNSPQSDTPKTALDLSFLEVRAGPAADQSHVGRDISRNRDLLDFDQISTDSDGTRRFG